MKNLTKRLDKYKLNNDYLAKVVGCKRVSTTALGRDDCGSYVQHDYFDDDNGNQQHDEGENYVTGKKIYNKPASVSVSLS